MKLKVIIDGTLPLQKLLNAPLNIRASFRLKQLVSQLDGVFKDFNASKTDLMDQYSETDEEGKKTIPDANTEAVDKAFKELLDTDISIKYTKVKASAIDGKVDLSATEYNHLDWLIDFDLEDEDGE